MLKSKFKVRQAVDMLERSENEDKATVSLGNALMSIGKLCALVPYKMLMSRDENF